MPSDPLSLWRERIDFERSAATEFLRLPPEVRESFLSAFGELGQHPERATPSLDIARIRNDPVRWRLKVEGDFRGIYRVVQGRVRFEMFQSREEVYDALRRYLISRRLQPK